MSDHREWARAQMTEANYPQEVKTAVERLLDVWWTQRHTDGTGPLTLDAFHKLAQGFAIVAPREGEAWAAVKPGNIVVRDQVRVKFDAYKGEAGEVHNDRRGVVVAIRHGDVIIKYNDGKLPAYDGVHHSPYALEKRVR